jgi:hypothetical protein
VSTVPQQRQRQQAALCSNALAFRLFAHFTVVDAW